MIHVKLSGSSKTTNDTLKKLAKREYMSDLSRFGALGVSALSAATPVDSGLTAQSWAFKVIGSPRKGRATIIWYNTNVQHGVSIALILQYGHGTGTGGWVVGRNYINPAIQPVFDQIANDVWEKVTRA